MIVYQDTHLTIFQSELYQTNTALIDFDSFILLIDPNWLLREVHFIHEFVQKNHAGKSIYLLLTHSDYDHILGYGLFPEAKVIASRRFQENPEKDKAIAAIHKFDQDHYIQRDYPILYPEVDFVIAQDGQELIIEGERLIFYLSPGHTADGLFTIVESKGIFIAGDYLSDLEFPFVYDSIESYLKTLNKVDHILQSHMINTMLPGHGQYLKDNNSAILQLKNRDIKYLTELQDAVRSGEHFDLEKWLNLFLFSDGLKEQHAKNEEHIRKEFAK